MTSETKPVTRFEIKTPAGEDDKKPKKSKIFFDGRDLARKVWPSNIRAQFQIGDKFLVVADFDCPFEEITYCFLFDSNGGYLGKKRFGFPFNWYLLEKVEVLKSGAVLLQFFAKGSYEVSVGSFWLFSWIKAAKKRA